MGTLYDKTGREIVRGDIVKVYHFTAAHRRKKHFMYKQALGPHVLGQKNPAFFMQFSHLDFKEEGYYQQMDGRILSDYEIVQSVDGAFEDRPRIKEGE